MQSAGFTETRSHHPIQNLAKASKLRCQTEYPRFVYSLLAPVDFLFSFSVISKLIIIFSSTSSIEIRAIAILSKTYLLIRSVLRDWTQKFAIPISFSEPRVGKSSFSTYFSMQINPNQELESKFALKTFPNARVGVNHVSNPFIIILLA